MSIEVHKTVSYKQLAILRLTINTGRYVVTSLKSSYTGAAISGLYVVTSLKSSYTGAAISGPYLGVRGGGGVASPPVL